MSVQTYNTIELRYASSELAQNQFVTEAEYKILEDEIEILRAERSHWHHMYNQEGCHEHC